MVSNRGVLANIHNDTKGSSNQVKRRAAVRGCTIYKPSRPKQASRIHQNCTERQPQAKQQRRKESRDKLRADPHEKSVNAQTQRTCNPDHIQFFSTQATHNALKGYPRSHPTSQQLPAERGQRKDAPFEQIAQDLKPTVCTYNLKQHHAQRAK